LSDALAGRTAVVTGASRGIGEAISVALANAGARIALLARSSDKLNALANRIGNRSFAVECDVTDSAAIDRAVDTITSELSGAPDILVNNAGLFTIKSVDDTSREEFQSIIATNLIAPYAFLNAFLKPMRQRGNGHIITIGSIADRHIYPGNAAYSAGKFGARAIHEVLRAELAGSGIRATLVSPAGTDTDIWEPIQYPGTSIKPDRSAMLKAAAVADAVVYAVTRPSDVNIDELRLSRS
jgi:NADP-dependent 3-hydroxy acid dehydrogenase YdfG